MPYDGSGNFNRTFPPGGWQGDAAGAIKIRADRHDQHDSDLAQGLSNAICRDGQSQVTADIPWNGRKITNLATPTDPTDAVTKAYADSIRNFVTGVSLTGLSAGPSPFVSTAYIGFTEADMSIVGRKDDTGTDPDVIKRIAFNDKADGTGADVFVINEDGTVTSRAADGTQKSFSPATAQARNRIINGWMMISQENGVTAGTANGYYGADMFLTSFASGGTITTQNVAVLTPHGTPARYRVTITVADAALATADYLLIATAIENPVDFFYGGPGALQTILRFGFKGPAGTYSVAIRNAAATRSYVKTFVISAGQANTDTEQVFVIPGDTAGTWGTNVSVNVVLAAGTTWQGVDNLWQVGAFIGTATNTNGMATAGSVFELFDVGLYLDPDKTGLPPKWQAPVYTHEFAACQRYFQWVATQFWGNVTNAVSYLASGRLAVPMRTPPVLSGALNISNSSFGTTPGTFAVFNQAGGGVSENRVSTATAAGGFQSVVAANARM